MPIVHSSKMQFLCLAEKHEEKNDRMLTVSIKDLEH